MYGGRYGVHLPVDMGHARTHDDATNVGAIPASPAVTASLFLAMRGEAWILVRLLTTYLPTVGLHVPQWLLVSNNGLWGIESSIKPCE